MKEEYNWWTDPKNKEEIERLSWWNHPEAKETFPLPISVLQEGETWVASTNDETEALLGKGLTASDFGDTKEEAIKGLFETMRLSYDYLEECRLKNQRWVPFTCGNWKITGGTWFTVFGIHVYFRSGAGMKGGWYIPFTKLNISINSDWIIYKRWKKNQKSWK